ncbi:MAG TPA: methyltransferase domain-containing protein, partial [Polyangiaceae bacterium]|nr:methyltransferase domain-containing protein [Polyangiaceae bacterium]
MSETAIPVAVPCNICGGTDFVGGPSGRLSMTKRLPLCSRCGSLERHRVVRAVFDALPGDSFQGKRCLQFSPDPALDPARFGEIVVSVWGGPNSLDMQAIALPDASFDLVYSSHVINHVADAPAALREMLRVVGRGCVALNVGGTVFRYTTADSQQFCGPDRQWKVYGSLYADELQAVLPEVAVLELIGIDPCSVTLDSVYFISVDEQRLTKMAEEACTRNVHARVFPAKRKPAPQLRVATLKQATTWDLLQDEIEGLRAEGGSAKFWLRDDDATTLEPRLIELVGLCERESVPLTLAVIPLPITVDLIEFICEHDLTPIQHGFDHRNHAAGTPKSEFPAERSKVEAVRTIQLGWYILEQAFGERVLPVFCSPWGTIAPKFRALLPHLGFTGYSGSRVDSEIHRRGTSNDGMRLASAHVAVNLGQREGAAPLPEERILQTLVKLLREIRKDGSDEPVGIMTHHWGVDE